MIENDCLILLPETFPPTYKKSDLSECGSNITKLNILLK